MKMRGREMRGKRRIYSEGRRREVSVNWREGGKQRGHLKVGRVK